MKRGEIWLVALDPTEGHEQKGRRPVLIVSSEAFSLLTKVPVVLPITSSGNFARTAGFAVLLSGAETKTTGGISLERWISARAAVESSKLSRPRSWKKCW
jgi:mRNA-degrading endonuclease toxin of MazEF toxin-antitoxin module